MILRVLELVQVFGADAYWLQYLSSISPIFTILAPMVCLMIHMHLSGLLECWIWAKGLNAGGEQGVWSWFIFWSRCPLMTISKLLLLQTSPNLHKVLALNKVNPSTSGRRYVRNRYSALILPVVDIVSTAVFSIHCRWSIFWISTCNISFLFYPMKWSNLFASILKIHNRMIYFVSVCCLAYFDILISYY